MGIIGLKKMFKDFNLFLLNLQEQIILFRLQPFLMKNSGFIKKTPKGCSVNFKKGNDEIKKQLNNEVENIFKSCKDNVDNLIEYIKNENIKIYRLKNADKTLKLFKEKSGLIPAYFGLKGLLINLYFNKKFSLKSEMFFVLDDIDVNIYLLLKDIHYVYFMKNNYTGFSNKYLLLSRKINQNGYAYLDKLTPNEISENLMAVASNLISINFVEYYSRKYEGSKEVFNKIQLNDAVV